MSAITAVCASGTSACTAGRVVTSRVRSGQLDLSRIRLQSTRDCGHYTASTGYGMTFTASASTQRWNDAAQARDVTGSVVVRSADGTSTCDWGVSRASFGRHTDWAVMTGETVNGEPERTSARSGFWIDSGCDLTSSAFLPRLSDTSMGFFDLGASRWYRGGSGERYHTSTGGSGTHTDPKDEGVDWLCFYDKRQVTETEEGTLVTGDTFTMTLPAD